MKVVTFLNEKGGVGKTTLSTHVAAGLAIKGYRVVFIDGDPQCTASVAFNFPVDIMDQPGLYQLLEEGEQWQNVMQSAPIMPLNEDGEPELSVVPAGKLYVVLGNERSTELIDSDNIISSPYNRFKELSNWADYIIVDTHPTPTRLHTAFLLSTDYILIPTETQEFSRHGVRKSIAHIAKAQRIAKDFGLTPSEILGIVPTKYNPQTGLHDVLLDELCQEFGDLVWDTGLALRIRHGEAALFHKMLFDYDPNHKATEEMNAIVDRVERSTQRGK